MDAYGLIILPLLIFLARTTDVSIGTLRIVFISRNFKSLAVLSGFFEILVWLLAITQVLKNLDNWISFFAYAGGYAFGSYVGMVIEEKLAMGKVILRIISQNDPEKLMQTLRQNGYGLTSMDAQGSTGLVKIIFMIINRKEVKKIDGILFKNNPKIFYSVEDIRLAKAGIFPISRNKKTILEKLHLTRNNK